MKPIIYVYMLVGQTQKDYVTTVESETGVPRVGEKIKVRSTNPIHKGDVGGEVVEVVHSLNKPPHVIQLTFKKQAL